MPYGSDPTTPPKPSQADEAARMMGWDVVSVDPITPQGKSFTPGLRLEIPGRGTQPTNTAFGSLPPEADFLYNRVRRAEGTAAGDGFVFYGGDSFTPGREHPGEAARRDGPQGKTHAAGPGQWQPDTWNGLKPDFEKRFGRGPDFSSQDDQKAMAWLNAGKIYPGGEDKLRADISAGKLNASALAPQWSGFGSKAYDGPWNVIGAGKWNVSSDAYRHGAAIPDAEVRWLDPLDYLAMLPPLEGDAANKSKRQSLARSLDAGQQIEDLPSLDVRREGSRFQVIDYDGRNRAELALNEGVGLIPVVIRGVGKGDKPSEIVGESGKVFPYTFEPVIYTPPPRKWWEKVGGGVGMGASDPIIGGAQLAGRTGAVDPAAAPYLPPEALSDINTGQGAATFDKAVQDREAAYQAQRRAEGDTGIDWGRLVGNVAAAAPLAAVPGLGAAGTAVNAAARAGAGAVGRLAAGIGAGGASGAATGAVEGALRPVTGPGDFASQKGGQIGQGALFGAAASAVLGGGSAGINILRSVVGPHTVTQAVARLFGEDAKQLTPELLAGVRSRTGATLERIETGYDIDLARDPDLLSSLDAVKAKARDLLGDEHHGGDAGSIVRAIDGILARATEDGIIPGKSAASLWHKGSSLDNLTESRNPDIGNLAQQAQNAVRSALNRQLPADEARLYSAARHQWRDLKIVEKSLRPGQTALDPQRFVTQVARRFPNHASQPGGPPMLRLGRAVGETWPAGADGLSQQIARHVFGHLIGAGAGAVAGGPGGAMAGTFVGRLLLDRLAATRVASPSALRALRPPPQPSLNGLALIQAMTQRAAPVAAPAMSFEVAR